MASILNLTAVSVDRYFHVTRPLNHANLITRPCTLVVIAFIWIFALIMALTKVVFWDFWSRNKPIYETLIVLLGFVLPILVISYCYIRIYQVVRNQLRKFMEQTKCLHQKTEHATTADTKTDFKAIKTIAVVVLAFFLCWCPFFALNLYNGWCRYYKGPKHTDCDINRPLMIAAKWLHYANSSLNPIIYACFNREFRYGFKVVLYRRLSSQGSTNNPTLSNMIKRASIRSVSNQL